MGVYVVEVLKPEVGEQDTTSFAGSLENLGSYHSHDKKILIQLLQGQKMGPQYCHAAGFKGSGETSKQRSRILYLIHLIVIIRPIKSSMLDLYDFGRLLLLGPVLVRSKLFLASQLFFFVLCNIFCYWVDPSAINQLIIRSEAAKMPRFMSNTCHPGKKNPTQSHKFDVGCSEDGAEIPACCKSR